ncbi:MAG: Crp/Fnr family transcriptional regulator [Solirubrobacterales bacterium]|nr:Crp/Fnr family transcriptional regulator [Solirubrobacterales bacterium]
MDWGWTVVEPVRLALLDRRFAAVVARWPALVDALVSRALRRSRTLAFQLTLAQVKRVEDRLVLLMWMLAERWGTVGPDGVLIPVGLTHETLAKLVGARRPTVTTALGALSRAGRVERIEHGWLLHGEPELMSDA